MSRQCGKDKKFQHPFIDLVNLAELMTFTHADFYVFEKAPDTFIIVERDSLANFTDKHCTMSNKQNL